VRSRSTGSVVCAVCGSQTARSATFCPRCGGLLAPEDDRPAGARPARRRWLAAGVALLAVVAAGVGAAGGPGGRFEPGRVAGAGAVQHDPVTVAGPTPPAAPTHAPAGSTTSPSTCVVGSEATCARLVLGGGPHRAAIRVGFGAVVVDEHLTVRRVRVDRDETTVPWSTSLRSPAEPGRDPGGPVALTRTGELAFVGTRTHLHSVEVEEGHHHWSVALRQAAGTDEPWTAWQVDDAVLASAGSTLVALDPRDGSLRWSRSVAGATVAGLRSGAAVLAPGRLDVVGPERRLPVWRLELPEGVVAVAGGDHRPVSGPLVLTGSRTLVVDVTGRRVLADLGERAVAASLANGHAIAVVWEDDGDDAVVLRWDARGRQQRRQPGPPVPCCGVSLHPLYDGRVLVAAPADPGEVVGWIVDPTDGRILQWLRRPEDVGWRPVTVARGVAVWRDGRAHVGTDAATGLPVWRAPDDATILLDGPVLLATPDGLVRP
jgi:outer membrane protein assembly factor BamB